MKHRFPNLAFPAGCSFEPVGMALVVEHGLVDFFLGIENKRSVLNDFLVEWQTCDEDYGVRCQYSFRGSEWS